MANTQAIKGRIKSVKNTKQITKAMELVAASKMRKAQEATLASRAYRNMAREILTRINKEVDVTNHPMYKQRTVNTKLYILITSDRGLAGAYNASILKKFTKLLTEDEANGITNKVIVIGKQGARFLSKVESVEVIGVYEDFPDSPSAEQIRPILDTAIQMFAGESKTEKRNMKHEEIDDKQDAEDHGSSFYDSSSIVNDQSSDQVHQVNIVYTDFISTVKQEPANQTILPAVFEEAESPEDLGGEKDEIPFEPSAKAVIETITPRLVEVQLYQAILESQASEHVSRMMAMKNASDNASDIIDALTLEYNSARQASITQEIAEITAGAEAMV